MTILFKVFAQASHHNASFPLARRLKERGHRVVYAVTAELASRVQAQGYEITLQKSDFLPPQPVRLPESRPHLLTRLKLTLAFYSATGPIKHSVVKCSAFDELVGGIRPDLILVDSPYVPFALSLLKHGIPFAILETMVPPDRAPRIPPLCSRSASSATLLGSVRPWLLWEWYLLKRRVRAALGFDVFFSRRTLSAAARNGGFPLERINFQKYLQLGLNGVPELILSPSEFDFPRQLKPGQYYIDVAGDPQRTETGYDACFDHLFDNLVQERARGKKLVFCALGTAAWRYRGILKFYRNLVRAARGEKWNLVLTVPDVDARALGEIPGNVHVFERVPQLKTLAQSDLMINHGGLNSIIECITLAVPCLVFPGTEELDQCGNAARVEYHKIGRMGHMQFSTAKAIRRMIWQALGNPVYLESVTAMQRKVRHRVLHGNPADIVERLTQP